MKKTTLKSLLAVALVFMLAFTVMLPAMAETKTYTITIEPGKYTNTSGAAANRFKAYQIFKGDVDATEPETGAEYSDKRLSSVKWGEYINGEELIAALEAVTANGFAEAIKGAVDGKKDQANELAKLLDAKRQANDSAFVQTFAETVAKYIADKNKTEEVITASGTSTFNGTNFVIGNLVPGYYIVNDTYVTQESDSDKHDSRSAYILDVFNNKTIKMKSDVPTLDKGIVTADNTVIDGVTTEIGKTLKFRLTASLPENFDMYKPYYYEFVDTLSKGLTYNKDIKITATYGTQTIDITAMLDTVDGLYNATYTPDADGNTIINVVFTDLHKVAGLTKDYNIIVEYTATLNKEAVSYDQNEDGSYNYNKAHLVFSNDPYDSSKKGETPDDEVYVYAFKLTFDKLTKDGDKLPGAKFKLYKYAADGETELYAYLTKTGNVYSLDTTKTDIWVADGGDVIETDGENTFTISGLEAGTYYLKEIEAPDGYNKMADIKVVIAVTEWNTDGTAKTVTVTLESDRDISGDVKDNNGVIELTNYKGSELPSTGGMGTTIFYVIGGIVLAGAMVLLVISKKKQRQ